jgi:hypothetical protein
MHPARPPDFRQVTLIGAPAAEFLTDDSAFSTLFSEESDLVHNLPGFTP